MNKINKEMSFFWGNSPMSWMRYLTLFSFRKYNPDWVIKLYTNSNKSISSKSWADPPTQDFFNYTGKDYSEIVKNLNVDIVEWEFPSSDAVLENKMGPSHKSNFFKWDLLGNKNGLYSDMDILFIKPMDTFYNKIKKYDTVLCFCDEVNYFSIGLMGSAGNNQFFKDIYINGLGDFSPVAYQSAGVLNMYKLLVKKGYVNTETYWDFIKKHYSNLNFYKMSMDNFYYWKFNQMGCVFEQTLKVAPDETFGIHWYAGDAISQKYNKLLNEENFSQYENTFTFFYKKLLTETK